MSGWDLPEVEVFRTDRAGCREVALVSPGVHLRAFPRSPPPPRTIHKGIESLFLISSRWRDLMPDSGLCWLCGPGQAAQPLWASFSSDPSFRSHFEYRPVPTCHLAHTGPHSLWNVPLTFCNPGLGPLSPAHHPLRAELFHILFFLFESHPAPTTLSEHRTGTSRRPIPVEMICFTMAALD